MRALSTYRATIFGIISLCLIFWCPVAQAQTAIKADFETVVAEETACGPSSNWPDSRARLKIQQRDGTTKVTIKVKDSVPDVFWTAWIRLAGTSPLAVTGMAQMGSTPMVPIAAINALAAVTPDGNLDRDAFGEGTGDNGTGSDNVINGFFTDGDGKGKLKLELDYPLIRGAIQFQEISEAFGPVAIGTKPTVPFTLRVVSHCLDNVGHGLVPGGELDPITEVPLSTPHEIWFEWSF